MSKKEDIINELNKGTPVEEICSKMEVSTSYVYRIKRENEELEGDEEDNSPPESNTSDGVAVDSTGGNSPNVEGHNKSLEEEESKRGADQTNKLGGVKKRKRSVKKVVQKDKNELITESEHKSGIKIWIKNQWKKALLILTSLILLIVMTLLSFKKKPLDQPMKQMLGSRFPVLR